MFVVTASCANYKVVAPLWNFANQVAYFHGINVALKRKFSQIYHKTAALLT